MNYYNDQIYGFIIEVEDIIEDRNIEENFLELDVSMEQTESDAGVETLLRYNIETKDLYEEVGGDYFSTDGTYSFTNQQSLAPSIETLEEALEDNLAIMDKEISEI